MSPEQAKGKIVDRSADVWAFGCVVFEMLSGRPAFDGETVGEVLGAIFRAEPEWNRLPADTPENIRRLLRRCLRKDTQQRLRDIHDARIELEESDSDLQPPSLSKVSSRRTERILWSALVFVSLVVSILALAVYRSATKQALSEYRLEILTPPTTDPLSFALSPDGRNIVFVASFEGRPRLWLRRLDAASMKPLPSTDYATMPFWSPDSRSVGFFVDGMIRTMDLESGAIQLVARAMVPAGAAWNRDGVIIFPFVPDSALFRVSSKGGPAMPIPNLTPRDAGHRDPQFLPDNKHFLYFVAGNPQRPDCIQDGLDGWKRQLVWIDRSGKEVANIDSAHDYGPSYLSMSPDGQQVALQRGVEGNADIWLLDLVRGGTVRFTTAPRPEIAPVWSPDGKRIVFSAFYTSQFDLYRKAIDGTAPELLLSAEDSKQATDWSRDGRYLLYRTINAAADFDIWALPLDGEKKPISVVHTPFEERDAQFFPDGKWIAYQSNESGRFEIYAQPFQRPGARIPISTNGGTQVRWRRDGKEIFYIAKDGRLMAVPLLTDSSGILKPGVAVPLF